MKSKWILTLFAAIPFASGLLVIQSCGGEGGPTGGGGGGLPGVTAQFMALLPDGQEGADYVGSETCSSAACHGNNGDPDSVPAHWQETEHSERGVGCERCHGPGSIHAANPSEDNILTFPKSNSPVVCAQCHGPLADQFNLSGHNLLIASPLDSAVQNPAGAKSSRCIACHSGLVRIEVNKAWDDNVDVFPTWSDEHIRTLAEDTLTKVPHIANCATCHDPHKRTANLTDTGEEVQLRRQVFNMDTAPVGPDTTPATFTLYNHACAQCHNGRGASATDAKLTSSTSRPNMHDSNQFNMMLGFGGFEDEEPIERYTAHATAPGQCSKCHMPESNHSFKANYDKGCNPCHSATDAASRVAQTRNNIIDALLALRERMKNWAVATFPGQTGNEIFWDYTSMIGAEGYTAPSQALIPLQIKRARHNYYFVIRSGDYGVHNGPYARHLISEANEEIDNLPGGPYAPGGGRAPTSNLTLAQKLQILQADQKKAAQADLKEIGN